MATLRSASTPAPSDPPPKDAAARLRRALTTVALVAAAWSVTLALTNGVAFTLGALHVSSRNARNPAFGAAALIALALLCAPRGARAQALRGDIADALRPLTQHLPRLARLLRAAWAFLTRPVVLAGGAFALVVFTLWLSWDIGSFVAGGSDSYGYVSEAHLFATGRLRMDLPLAAAFPHAPIRALTPLAYEPAPDGSPTLVPTYPPGLPLTMALFERLGGMRAVYAVMPLLAALSVWCAYRLGRQVAGPGTGFGASVLLSASPAFIYQLIFAPMSDIPAAGWWSLSLTLLLDTGGWIRAASAGMAAGLAILTRPNLLLVVVILGCYLLWQVTAADADRRTPITRLVAFSLPVIAACLTVAAFNTTWFGSPLRSGYSGDLFSISFWDDNIQLFSGWLTESQTPLFLIGFLAPFLVTWLPGARSTTRPAAWLLVGVVLAVFASYVFYTPFDAWWFLRFLLPAFPALAVLTAVTLAALAARFGAVARICGVLMVVGAALFGCGFIKGINGLGEYRFRIIGEWVRDRLPEKSIVFAMLHSGSVMHYSGRAIVRYDLIPIGDFESALREMTAAGYHPYLVVDEWEIDAVRRRHGNGLHGALDWPPLVRLPLNNVQVFDLAEDVAAARASGRKPELIPIPAFLRRHQH